MPVTLINPQALRAPSGYSHGVLADAHGKVLFISGPIASNEKQTIGSAEFVQHVDRAVANVITVVREAGARPEHIVRLIVYVTNKVEYRGRTREVGERYRKHLGKHFPAMVLVEVAGLLDDLA